jgi:hypothetical protein
MRACYWRPPLFASSAALLIACGNEDQRPPGPALRDSAGVQIVENTGYRWPEGRGWRLSDEPSVDIGVLDGDPNYQLFRVVGAVRLSDGRLVVANSGTNELRFYDPSGTYVVTSGRRGGGPGEFGGLSWLGTSEDDSLLTYDWPNRRISVFDADGGFARGFVLRELSHAPPSHVHPAPLADGSLLVGAQRFFSTGPLTTGAYHDTIFHLVFDGEGVLADTVGRHAGAELYVAAVGEQIDLMPLPFGRSAHAAPWRDGFFFGSGASYEIAYFSRTGGLFRLVRKTHTGTQVTPAHIRRYVEAQLEGIDDESERRFMESLFAEVPFPETMPAYQGLLVDAEGHLWVREYQPSGEEHLRWTVFDPEAVMLGVVETPPRFRVYQIGSDFVLGRWTDDLDVEHVQLYQLLKEPGAT